MMKIRHLSIDKFKTMRPSKRIILTVCAVLIFCMITGGSIAWLVSISDPVNNEFDPAEVTITIIEDFSNNLKQNVQIGNTGDIDAYIRVALVPAWVDENGNVAAQEASLADCTIKWGEKGEESLDSNPDWFMVRNGDDDVCYCYCRKAIAPGDVTPILIKECKVNKSEYGHQYDFELRIVASAVQAIPTSAVTEAWSVEVDDSGILIIPSSPTPSVPPTPFASPEENQGGN